MLSQATQINTVKQGWLLTLGILIFFLNSLLPTTGLTITLLLTPAWVFYLYSKGQLQHTLICLLPLAVFVIAHLLLGVDVSHYLLSISIICCTFFFVAAFSVAVKGKIDLDNLFRMLLVLNGIFVLISLPLFFSSSLREWVWYMVPISNGMVVPRLKLFTPEASHYSLWLAPIAIYYFSIMLFLKPSNAWFTLLLILVPLLLSFSLGVLAAMAISFLMVFIFYYGKIISTALGRRHLFAALLGGLVLVALLYFLFPNNPLFLRLAYVWQGKDTSARGRTFEAFILANKIISLKSYLWGIGPGQLNILGRNTILQYYQYSNSPVVVRIPNACAETILFFGYIGFALRLTLQFFLFFKTRVFTNPYRLWLFVFVFIYQFTGSYITNTTEYIIWILAFSNVFPELNIQKLKPANLST
jgi:hypothetical protein